MDMSSITKQNKGQELADGKKRIEEAISRQEGELKNNEENPDFRVKNTIKNKIAGLKEELAGIEKQIASLK